MASPRTVTIVALSVALGLFFVFMGTIKLTPRLSRDAYNEMVRPAEGRPRGSRVGTATASERRREGGREPSAGYGGGGTEREDAGIPLRSLRCGARRMGWHRCCVKMGEGGVGDAGSGEGQRVRPALGNAQPRIVLDVVGALPQG